ncbi:MAG: DUF1289 domain-containing protein [Leptospiraceae bacterium]|nr:DUF1289 domain-containing protein [Leptospiraceae bacterium]
MRIASPCIKVCEMDPASMLCQGCGRSLQEIGRWSVYTDQERRAIMQQLPERLRRLHSNAPPIDRQH